jgi:hypothetical protein
VIVDPYTPWCAGPAADTSALDAVEREAFAAHYRHLAALEHAAVAAFADLRDTLEAFGAPAHLLADAHRGRTDEVHHAELAFALAASADGRPDGPGRTPQPPRPIPDLAGFAAYTIREGCIGEAVSAAHAGVQLMTATDPAVRDYLASVVEDESRHASLAWRIVRWDLDVGNREVRAAALAAFDDAIAEVGARAAPLEVSPRLRALGLVSQQELDAAVERCVADVIVPAATDLFGDRARRAA